MNSNKIGLYKIIRKIGEGRYGEVFLVQDEVTNKYFSIREFNKDLIRDDCTVERLREGVNSLTKLAHNNIVQVKYLEQQEGCFYLIMEYVDGIHLNDFIYYGKTLNWKLWVGFAIEMLSALEYAKNANLMHLGIKPNKIMISNGQYLKIRDFGMMNIFSVSKRTNYEFNNFDLQYRAPEQISDELGDDRSDIYSIAVILYHSLSGHPPFFKYDNPNKIKHAHLNEQAPLLKANVPAELKELVMRGLAKKPERRFDSAQQFKDELSKLLLNWDAALQIQSSVLGSKANGLYRSSFDDLQNRNTTQDNKTYSLIGRVIAAAIITLLILSLWKIYYYADEKFIEPGLVLLNKACFVMGSPATEANRYPDETPHNVCVKGFKMGKYEVTFEEYDLFAHATGRPLPEDDGYGRGRYPVFRVSWTDANAYAAWLSKKTNKHYRLPTEAEWEYAARTGTTMATYWGEHFTPEKTCQYINYMDCKNAMKRAMPVGSFKANDWGLYDMLGNVLEMTGSAYYGQYNGAEQRQANLNDGKSRVTRGGSWHKDISSIRFAWRGRTQIDRRHDLMGFRLAQDLTNK